MAPSEQRLDRLPAQYRVLYALMTTDQVPADVIAEWLADPVFARYVRSRRHSQ